MEVTFGAVGDFISVILVIRDIITALNDSRGSTRDYLELTESLQVLEKALKEVDEVFKDPRAPKELESLRLVALDTARQITRRATEFRERMKKYAHSLSHGGSGNPIKDTVRKLQWKLDEGDISKFRGEIVGYTASLNILLHATTMQLIKYNQTETQQCLGLMETRTTATIKQQAQNLHVFLGQVASRVNLTLQTISSMGDDLRQASRCVITIGSAVYKELRGLRALVTRLERPIIEEHFTLEDAIGRRIPIHLRTITSWDTLDHIIREQFKGRNGEHRVARHRYALQDHATHNELSRTTPWSRAFRPYQKVNMSILCNEMPNESHTAPTKSCPWCHHGCSSGEITEIQCENCGMFYTRVKEIEEIDAETQDQQLHKQTPKFGEPSFKFPPAVGCGDFFKRKRDLKDTKRSGEYRQPQKRIRSEPLNQRCGFLETKEELESESDEDDVDGLVRVRLISKQRKMKGRRAFLSYCSSGPAVFESTPPSELSAPASAKLSMTDLSREKIHMGPKSEPSVQASLETIQVREYSPEDDASECSQEEKLGLTEEKDQSIASGSESTDEEEHPAELDYILDVPDHRIIHERKFQLCKTTQYWGPIDEVQLEGLETARLFLTLLKDNRLFEAPLPENPSKILDLGTGTGIWAIEMAEYYPSAGVIGTDICAIQPEWAPPNCMFFLEDAQLEWPDFEASLDFIHIRALYGSIDNWPRLYRKAYRTLVPGGWIEHFEFDITLYSQAPEVRDDEDHIFKQWSRVLLEAMDRAGKTGRIGMDGNMRKYVEEAGFVDIVEKNYRVPCGEWMTDTKLKDIGFLNLLFWEQSLEGFALFLLKEIMGWEYTEITTFVARMHSALSDAKTQPYCLMTNVYAKKP
ncbi:hypothetical protein NM208_g11523 [Fusarium decemcellulare]|uniref:Uncharacterized protein n=1 Tax=Fusarium decemcellulare TaxID=57161 RepID=A0ACC1RTY7_9HYPO|nr:hypothetical protein NM208_g11523 [Fusarium decemcellulare]